MFSYISGLLVLSLVGVGLIAVGILMMGIIDSNMKKKIVFASIGIVPGVISLAIGLFFLTKTSVYLLVSSIIIIAGTYSLFFGLLLVLDVNRNTPRELLIPGIMLIAGLGMYISIILAPTLIATIVVALTNNALSVIGIASVIIIGFFASKTIQKRRKNVT